MKFDNEEFVDGEYMGGDSTSSPCQYRLQDQTQRQIKRAYFIPGRSSPESFDELFLLPMGIIPRFSNEISDAKLLKGCNASKLLRFVISTLIAACCTSKFPVLRWKAVESAKTHCSLPLKGVWPPWASFLQPSSKTPTDCIL